jgi:hypothetical protein
VPKCENFDRSDFHNFYTIFPFFWEGDFVVKILTYYYNFWGSQASLSFWCASCMSIRVRSWCVRSACTSVPYAHAQCTHQFLTHMLSWSVCSAWASVPDAHAQRTHQFLTRMLRVRVSHWCICWPCFERTARPKIILSISVRNFNVAVETLWCKNHENSSDRKSHYLGTFKSLRYALYIAYNHC